MDAVFHLSVTLLLPTEEMDELSQFWWWVQKLEEAGGTMRIEPSWVLSKMGDQDLLSKSRNSWLLSSEVCSLCSKWMVPKNLTSPLENSE